MRAYNFGGGGGGVIMGKSQNFKDIADGALVEMETEASMMKVKSSKMRPNSKFLLISPLDLAVKLLF